MYRIVEDQKYKQPYLTGPEMQVLDNKCHPDAKIITHRSGDFYDVMASKTENVKPAGEWNSVRIIMKGYKLEQWQNGVRQIKLTLGSDEINAIVEKVNGKIRRIGERLLLVKLAFKIMEMPFGFVILKFAVCNFLFFKIICVCAEK